MAKRRRRIKIKNSSLFALIILLNCPIIASSYHQHNNHYNQQQQDYRATSSQQLPVSSPASGLPSTAHLCARLPVHVSRHLKLCKLISQSPNADEAVALGAAKGLAECQSQFRSERWNCTHVHGDHHLLTSELAQSVGNRESGFVHAIAAAGIVHSIATACSVGNLSDCACDKSRIGSNGHMDEKWKWGGCSNNIRHGMVFAKHLVELLDAFHQHQHLQHQHQHQHLHLHSQQSSQNSQVATTHLETGYSPQGNAHTTTQLRRRRSLSSRHREPNQLRGRHLGAGGEPQVTAASGSAIESSSSDQAPQSFCQRNHNISQAAHLKLIKSLLSANSLEKHQEFRLAMNMHNNKVGRMAVAKNMEFRCRCHGLSGSCSLKTCWLSLPNFQVIGAYLKKKYDTSVHLPSAVDVNKLIPMMNRDEISAILSNQAISPNAVTEDSISGHRRHLDTPLNMAEISVGDRSTAPDELSSEQQSLSQASINSDLLQADQPIPNRLPLSGHFIVSPATNQQQQQNLSNPVNQPSTHHIYYERHRHLQMTAAKTAAAAAATELGNPKPLMSHQQATNLGNNQTQVEESERSQENEIPVNIAPLSQQQYQALLRDMRLCNTTDTISGAGNGAISHLTTRDLQQQQQQQLESHQQQLSSKRHILRKIHNNNQQQQTISGQSVKSANQHLSQILHHSNKDELIYLHRSPNYCEADLRHGFVGIQSRVCSDNPMAPNNCDKLCCGRGYSTRIFKQSYRCDCKFQYCCSIHCSLCERETKLLVCN